MIRNLTPHPINLYLRDDTDAALVHFGPGDVVPVAGPPARLRTIDLGTFNEGTAVYESVEFGHVNGLPEPEPGVWYVVSLPVVLVCHDRRDLMVPYREVRGENGTVVGCRSLARPS